LRYIDVSIEISNDTVWFPGDPKPTIEKTSDIDKGDQANVSKLSISSHCATHIDAPSHFIKDGTTIDKLDLDYFHGKVKVIEVEKDVITSDILKMKDIKKGDRIFFKTKNSQMITKSVFQENYTFLSLDGAQFLVGKKVKVIGIDYLSIEEFNSNAYSVHKILLSNGIVIIEGINLNEVDEGEYEYFAFPLKIKDCDASPVRVVLSK